MLSLAGDMAVLAASSRGHTWMKLVKVEGGRCVHLQEEAENATDMLRPAKPIWPSGLSVVGCCVINREPGSLGALWVQTHP